MVTIATFLLLLIAPIQCANVMPQKPFNAASIKEVNQNVNLQQIVISLKGKCCACNETTLNPVVTSPEGSTCQPKSVRCANGESFCACLEGKPICSPIQPVCCSCDADKKNPLTQKPEAGQCSLAGRSKCLNGEPFCGCVNGKALCTQEPTTCCACDATTGNPISEAPAIDQCSVDGSSKCLNGESFCTCADNQAVCVQNSPVCCACDPSTNNTVEASPTSPLCSSPDNAKCLNGEPFCACPNGKATCFQDEPLCCACDPATNSSDSVFPLASKCSIAGSSACLNGEPFCSCQNGKAVCAQEQPLCCACDAETRKPINYTPLASKCSFDGHSQCLNGEPFCACPNGQAVCAQEQPLCCACDSTTQTPTSVFPLTSRCSIAGHAQCLNGEPFCACTNGSAICSQIQPKCCSCSDTTRNPVSNRPQSSRCNDAVKAICLNDEDWCGCHNKLPFCAPEQPLCCACSSPGIRASNSPLASRCGTNTARVVCSNSETGCQCQGSTPYCVP